MKQLTTKQDFRILDEKALIEHWEAFQAAVKEEYNEDDLEQYKCSIPWIRDTLFEEDSDKFSEIIKEIGNEEKYMLLNRLNREMLEEITYSP